MNQDQPAGLGRVESAPAVKTLIVCQSVHHGNTMKVARAMAGELDAEIRTPAEVAAGDLDEFDLVGFGSGIHNQKHHASLFRLVDSLESSQARKCFVFSTASICYLKMHQPLKAALESRGFQVLDQFISRGFMDFGWTKLWFGGINKGRPNEKDLDKARAFAVGLKAL